MTTSHNPPRAFHVMAKPTGAICNLNCAYCFFLKKEALYPGDHFRMSDELMERYIRETIEAHQTPEVVIAWQGGEPTLMGLDFFKRSVEVEKKYQKPGTIIQNTLQTNGTLLDDEWCEFLRENKFLVGLSLDGPREMHDRYRVDRAGRPTFDRVMNAVRLMQKHKVDFNILCTVNAANGDHPLDVYRFFRDEAGAEYLQFIPVVERVSERGFQEGNIVTDRSVGPGQYGRFLIEIFDEWVRRDVGRMFVQQFDATLMSWVRGYSSLCIFRPTCGEGVVLEHNGDVYSCDHFVEPDFLLGNIVEMPLIELVGSEAQHHFGHSKADLTRQCSECFVRFACNGDCPKHRFTLASDGEPGLSYLCAGHKAFFEHVNRPMQIMAELLRHGQLAEGVMRALALEDGQNKKSGKPGRNDPCPCGSGHKYKRCHGRSAESTAVKEAIIAGGTKEGVKTVGNSKPLPKNP
jgi:uncharacterized protein